MTTTQIPPNYIRRENSESTLGKSPKTVFRHIKKAIETGGPKSGQLLEHCYLQLLDGQIIAGTQVTGMGQIDRYRQQGKVPSWYIDADFFSEYFADPKRPASGKSPMNPSKGPAPEGPAAAGAADPAIIAQYEARLADKDEQIRELRIDKNDLRQQLKANTNLTERITALLSHSQLAALGLPEGFHDSSDVGKEPSGARVIDGTLVEDQPAEGDRTGEGIAEETLDKPARAGDTRDETVPKAQRASKRRSSGSGASTARSNPKPRKRTPQKTVKPASRKRSIWTRDLRELFRR